MYPVSEKYIEQMDQNIREISIAMEMSLIRLDMDQQTGYTLTGSDGIEYGDMLQVNGDHPVKKATLERDYMRADGTYSPHDVTYYISPVLSAEEADSDGLYPIEACGVTLTPKSGVAYLTEFTLVTEPGVGRIQVTRDNFTMIVDAADGIFRVTEMIGTPGAAIDITVLSMRGPQRRAHLYQVYMGSLEIYQSQDIISASCVDINDVRCLELPQKTISVVVSNLDGRYDPETEYTTPTFRRFHTQALIQLYAGKELCGLGRWFLDTYTVDEAAVTFNFVGPLTVMNEYPHLWSTTEKKYFHERVTEIVNPGLELMDIASDKPIRSGAELYGIVASGSDFGWWYDIYTPPPPVSGAQALQLLCNYGNHCILQGRKWLDPNGGTSTFDLRILSVGSIFGSRRIPNHLLYGAPKWQVEEVIGRITADVYSQSSETAEETVADNLWLAVGYDTAVTTDQPISSVAVPEEVEGGGYGYAARTAAYTYTWYYTAREQSYYTPTPVKAQVYKTIKTPVTVVYGEGTEKTLSNPMLCKESGGSSDITVQDYIERIYSELKHNLTATISHRGYPELDAGEFVMLQTKPDGEYVECRVLENRWTLANGMLKGTTKVRRWDDNA